MISRIRFLNTVQCRQFSITSVFASNNNAKNDDKIKSINTIFNDSNKVKLSTLNMIEDLKFTVSNMANNVMFKYNDALGQSEIEKYHNNLFKIEKSLMESNEKKRGIQENLTQLRARINELRVEMEKVSQDNSKYVQLFIKVHDLLKVETQLVNSLKNEEETERILLTFYVDNVRKSFQAELDKQSKNRHIAYTYYIASSFLAIFCYIFGRYRNMPNAKYDEHFTNLSLTVDGVYKNLERLSEKIFEKSTESSQVEQNAFINSSAFKYGIIGLVSLLMLKFITG